MLGRLAFIDSNIWLYAFIDAGQEDAKRRKACALLADLEAVNLSTQVVAEVSVNLIKKAGANEQLIRDITVDFQNRHRVNLLTVKTFMFASKLRGKYSLSFFDSLIVASALDAGCSVLYTEDLRHGQVIEDQLTVINPFVGKEHQ